MKEEHGFDLPRRLQIEFSKTIQHITEDSGTEITPATMWGAFESEYLPPEPRYRLRSHELHTESSDAAGRTRVTAQLEVDGAANDDHRRGRRAGRGVRERDRHPFRRGVRRRRLRRARDRPRCQCPGSAYVETVNSDNEIRWGIGQDPNITTASLRAVLNAFERQHG